MWCRVNSLHSLSTALDVSASACYYQLGVDPRWLRKSVASCAGQLRVWDLYSGSLQQLLRPAEAAITSLQLVDSPSGSPACLAATGHADGSCVFLDLGSGSQALTLPGQWRHRPSSNGAKDEQDGRNQPAFMSVAQARPLSVVGQHHCLRGWDLRFLKGQSQTGNVLSGPIMGVDGFPTCMD